VSLVDFKNAKLNELNNKTYKPLLDKILTLPKCQSDSIFDDTIEIKTDMDVVWRDFTRELAISLRSWRKGPFRIDELFIDAEWKSFIKYNLLLPYLNLDGKIVGDIGCNNAYYMFRMLNFSPKRLIGFDPSLISYLQFRFINHFVGSNIEYELIGVEHLVEFGIKFDTLFCLGVIYHRSDPIKMLKELKSSLNSGGEVFLDTMYIDMDGDFALSPKKTYSKIQNIYFVPTISALLNWCERANFKDIEILAIKSTDLDEQRKTEWILGQSLGDFLDPTDLNRTIEGYPAPRRVYLRLSV